MEKQKELTEMELATDTDLDANKEYMNVEDNVEAELQEEQDEVSLGRSQTGNSTMCRNQYRCPVSLGMREAREIRFQPLISSHVDWAFILLLRMMPMLARS
jgi:hypothetical protein